MFLLTWFRRWQSWRAKRDAKASERWNAFVMAGGPGCEIIQIIRKRQKARNGFKGYARWIESGEIGAVWFYKRQPKVGSFLCVLGSEGHGEHHDEPVFYVRKEALCVELKNGSKVYAGMRRHVARTDALQS